MHASNRLELKLPQILQEKIALLLIGGAFVIIIVILAIHSYNTGIILNSVAENFSIEQLNLYREIGNSNLSLFSIIFSLFGAWVGAVLAFYFGSQSLEKAYKSLSQAQSSIDNIISDNRLAGIKVSDMIADNPDSRNLLKVKLGDKISRVIKDSEDRNYSYVMVTDDTEKQVLGLLFISDLTNIKSKTELLSPAYSEVTLEVFITDNEIKDAILKKKWTKEGIRNFITVTMDDSLKTVVEKMKQLDDSLSVRAVVMEDGVPIATVTYDMISKQIKR